jgi:hypothetical protein
MKLRLSKIHCIKKNLNEGIKHFDCNNCIYSRTVFSRNLYSENLYTENLYTENKQVCILFKYNFLHEDPYVETAICRNDINLCGKHGEYFTLKEN